MMRAARADDLPTVISLTTDAYAPYTALFGAPPIPVTEGYAPRIQRGEVWLLEQNGQPAGLIVLERHADHTMIFSVAVAPAFQGKGFGIGLLDWAEQQTRCGACLRSDSTPMPEWNGTFRCIRPTAFAKRVAGPIHIGQDGRSSTWRSRRDDRHRVILFCKPGGRP